ncbi:DUF3024 domain-containing protein [Antarcticibacterium flavum]|uniref:DUF3024 domain-containing protein n=1 Tax=Antarcticibacterium flavum TaxID=2058175 RepID=A0A5B7X0H8_9FLAO|nr:MULTISPECIES: DUF3024 domain-containing protein [Antarcticibacterium]MCM4161300.1 hypothetical protein [Antarcticibacterium sp. W02-3]QCY69084.1 DUF3024 domain-containing protein [Antarcticibacterium flavum]
MAFDQAQLTEIKIEAALFLNNNRPPGDIRHLLDLDFYIKGQSVIIYELRPDLKKANSVIKTEAGKATYVKNTNCWKVYGKDKYLNWERYEPIPAVENLRDFFHLVEEDEKGYFICKLVLY